MIKLITFAAVALAVTTSVKAMPVAPVHEPDGMITQVAYGCGPFRTRVHGVCAGENHRSPDTPPLSQVCTMAWRRLCARYYRDEIVP